MKSIVLADGTYATETVYDHPPVEVAEDEVHSRDSTCFCICFRVKEGKSADFLKIFRPWVPSSQLTLAIV